MELETVNRLLADVTGNAKTWFSAPCSQEQVIEILKVALSKDISMGQLSNMHRRILLNTLGDIAPSVDMALLDRDGYFGTPLHFAARLNLETVNAVVKLYKRLGEDHLIHRSDMHSQNVLDYLAFHQAEQSEEGRKIVTFLQAEGVRPTSELLGILFTWQTAKWTEYQKAVHGAQVEVPPLNPLDQQFLAWLGSQGPNPLSYMSPSPRIGERMLTPWDRRTWGKELTVELQLGHHKIRSPDLEEAEFFLKFSTTRPELVQVKHYEFTGTMAPEVGKLFAQILAASPKLASLSLSHMGYTNATRVALHNIDVEGATPLADVLKTNNTLGSLTIAGGYLGPQGGTVLADALQFNSGLTALSLTRNALGNEGANAVAKMLSRNASLLTLEIANHNFSVAGVQAIAEALVHNTTLTELEIQSREFDTVEGFISLLDMLSRNENLVHLQHADGLPAWAQVGAEETDDKNRLLAYNKMLTEHRNQAGSREKSFDLISLMAQEMFRIGKAKKMPPLAVKAAVDELWMSAKKTQFDGFTAFV